MDAEQATTNGANQEQQEPAAEDGIASLVIPLTDLLEALKAYLENAQDTAKDAKTENERAEQDLEAQRQMAHWAESMVNVTWAATGVTAAGVVLIFFTLIQTGKILKEAKTTTKAAIQSAEAAHRAVDESQQATKAARDAVAVTEQTTKHQLRAYLSLAPGKIAFDPTDFGRLIVYATQKNNGQTPAQKTRFFGCVQVLPYPLPKEHLFPIPEFYPGANVVHPGHRFSVDVKGDIFAHDLIAEATDRAYVFALLSYMDVFGERRETRACWCYDRGRLHDIAEEFERAEADPTRKGPKKPVSMGFEYAEHHNYAT